MSPDNDGMATEWVTLAAFLAAFAVGGFVFLALAGAESTDCYHESVDITIVDATDRVEGCQDLKTFKAVNAHIAAERRAIAEDADYAIREVGGVAGRGHLAVWIALFAATAAVSGYVFVRGIAARHVVRPTRGQSILDFVLAVGLLGVTFWFLNMQPFEFSDYEDIHTPVITYVAYFVGFLLTPALMTMIACGRACNPKELLDLKRVGEIGDTLRLMVSLAGAVLALAVITTGARSVAIAELPGADPIPSSVVLIWGAVFAIALAIIYVPSHQRWSATLNAAVAHEILLQFGGEAQPGTPGYRPAELSAKKELQASLGTKGPFAVLQGSFSVLAPVIAAAVSSVFIG